MVAPEPTTNCCRMPSRDLGLRMHLEDAGDGEDVALARRGRAGVDRERRAGLGRAVGQVGAVRAAPRCATATACSRRSRSPRSGPYSLRDTASRSRLCRGTGPSGRRPGRPCPGCSARRSDRSAAPANPGGSSGPAAPWPGSAPSRRSRPTDRRQTWSHMYQFMQNNNAGMRDIWARAHPPGD